MAPSPTSKKQSVNDIIASDLPTSTKRDLILFAHELAGSLVYDYNLDISDNVFALGKTSSLVGHRILSIMEGIVNEHKEGDKRNMRGLLLGERHQSLGLDSNLEVASLVLIDRNEDLSSPSSNSGPLAQRILNTLNLYQYSNANDSTSGRTSDQSALTVKHCVEDVSIVPESLRLNPLRSTTATSTQHKLQDPMTGLANLSVQIAPSLCYNALIDRFHMNAEQKDDGADDALPVLYNVLSGTEESGRVTLCNELKIRIAAEKGNLPLVKKRGLGAEVLAHVTAIAEAPGSTSFADTEQLGYNPGVCLRSQGLIALSLAVVEAMQRSNGRQFSTVCAWQCSFDVRAGKEASLDDIIRRSRFDLETSLDAVGSFLTPAGAGDSSNSTSNRNNSSNSNGGSSGSNNNSPVKKKKGSKKDAQTDEEPVDVMHVLLLLVRVVSSFRGREMLKYLDITPFQTRLTTFLLEHSVLEELQYLADLSFLPSDMIRTIQDFRSLKKEREVSISGDGDLGGSSGSSGSSSGGGGVGSNGGSAGTDINNYNKNNSTSNKEGINSWDDKGNDFDLDDAENNTNSAADEESPLVDFELRQMSQLSLDVRDTVCASLRPIAELAHMYALSGDKDIKTGLVDVDAEVEITRSEPGLVGRLVLACLHTADPSASYSSGGSGKPLLLQELLEYVETPLQQMKRAGMGLLSRGLGSLGWGSNPVAAAVSSPHPRDQNVVVVFVVGGVSYKEVGHVREVVERWRQEQTGGSRKRVLLMSNRTVNAEDTFHSIFSSL